MKRTVSVVRSLAAMSAGSLLAACGGSGGNPGLSPAEVDRLNADPRIMRLERIVNLADTLIIPRTYSPYSLSIGGQTLSGRLVQNYRCSGTRCYWSASTQFGRQSGTIDLNDLPTNVGVTLTQVTLGYRAGFDTQVATANLTNALETADIKFNRFPNAKTWGFWGQSGYAFVSAADGPIRGTVDGNTFSGSFAAATAGMLADATGRNPSGSGSATWTGLAEAASARTYTRHSGTASLTIPNLTDPRITAQIIIAGSSIGSSAWNEMQLARGRFGGASAGVDRIEGVLAGSSHEEAWGVFDTGNWAGAFGARRSQ